MTITKKVYEVRIDETHSVFFNDYGKEKLKVVWRSIENGLKKYYVRYVERKYARQHFKDYVSAGGELINH